MKTVYLGAAPCNEDCGILGGADYDKRVRRECEVLIGQLKRKFGEPPQDAEFLIAEIPDGNTGLSVVIQFDSENDDAADYAFRCEDEFPCQWDVVARLELEAARKRGGAA